MRLDRSDLELEVVVRRIADQEIDLQPDFQRGEVWDAPRQRRLIDTIIRGWYVPAVHLVGQDFGPDVVLDGQQRLVSIRDFFAGELKVDGNTEPFRPEIGAHHNSKYDELPVAMQRSIRRFPLTVITLRDYEPAEPHELFFRLNQHYPLSPPEKRNALYGAARDQVKHLVADLKRAQLLDPLRVGFDNGRLAYDDVVARSCVAVERGTLRSPITTQLVEHHYRAGPFSDDTLTSVREAGRHLKHLCDVSGPVRLNKATLFTWLVFLVRAHSIGLNVPEDLMAVMESQRRRVKAARRGGDYDLFTPELDDRSGLGAMLDLYNDRSSYRVADTTSVMVRDLVLHMVTLSLRPQRVAADLDSLLDRLRFGHLSGDDLIEYVQSSDWGLWR